MKLELLQGPCKCDTVASWLKCLLCNEDSGLSRPKMASWLLCRVFVQVLCSQLLCGSDSPFPNVDLP